MLNLLGERGNQRLMGGTFNSLAGNTDTIVSWNFNRNSYGRSVYCRYKSNIVHGRGVFIGSLFY